MMARRWDIKLDEKKSKAPVLERDKFSAEGSFLNVFGQRTEPSLEPWKKRENSLYYRIEHERIKTAVVTHYDGDQLQDGSPVPIKYEMDFARTLLQQSDMAKNMDRLLGIGEFEASINGLNTELINEIYSRAAWKDAEETMLKAVNKTLGDMRLKQRANMEFMNRLHDAHTDKYVDRVSPLVSILDYLDKRKWVSSISKTKYADNHYIGCMKDSRGLPLLWFVFSLAAVKGRRFHTMILHGWTRSLLTYVDKDPVKKIGAFAFSLILEIAASIARQPIAMMFMESLAATDGVIGGLRKAGVSVPFFTTASALSAMPKGVDTGKEVDMIVVTETLSQYWKKFSETYVEPERRRRRTNMCIQCYMIDTRLHYIKGSEHLGTFCGMECALEHLNGSPSHY